MKLQWTTEKRKVNDLIPYDKNPRTISDEQKKQLQKSIEKFNLVEPPAIDTDGVILSGHQRIKVMQDIGWGDQEIDVRVPNRKLTTKEVDEINLRMNKNRGEFDFNLLKEFDKSLLAEVGFDEDLDDIFPEELEEDNFDADAEVAKITTPIAKTGDIYQLGNHRLMCGDSTKLEDVELLMGGGQGEVGFYRSALQCRLLITSRKYIQLKKIWRHWWKDFQRQKDRRGVFAILY